MRKIEAVLEILKIFVQIYMYPSPSPFMDEVLSEERASYNNLELMKSVGIF